MKRILKTLLRALLITLLITIAFAWHRSYQLGEGVFYKTPRIELRLASSHGAIVAIYRIPVPPADLPRVGWGFVSQPRDAIDQFTRARERYPSPAKSYGSARIGAYVLRNESATEVTRAAVISYRFLAATIGTLLAAVIVKRRLWPALRARWRRKRKRCTACGYDLRGSTGVCPECGLAIPASPQAARPPMIVDV
jgi:hypothetical protein